VVRFARNRYPGANHTHLSELLWEHEGLALSRFTVRRILGAAAMPSPRRLRPPEHRVQRARMPREGLLQVDGSHHAWLEECEPRFTLPLALYTDRHGVFQEPLGREGRCPPTQFARALGELGITQVFARSPQAKGRLERFAGTLQDRLATELRLTGTATIAEADWFGVPSLPQNAFGLSLGLEFWALLPTFAIMTIVTGITNVSHSVATLETSLRRNQAVDFRKVQGVLGANGVGMLLAGLAGAPPPGANSSIGSTLIEQTGVASRRAGFGIALVFLSVAFVAKFQAILLAIPAPVLAAYLTMALGLYFVSGFRAIVRDGLDPERALIVAVSLTIDIGLHEHPIMDDLLGSELGGLVGNGVMLGTVVAMVMTLAINRLGTRSSRLEVALAMDSLPAINRFLQGLASDRQWSEASSLRLRAAGEEALVCLLAQELDAAGQAAPQLALNARPEGNQLELEFIAAASEINVEGQLALVSDEASLPNVDELSLRLLKHHAAVVRHQQFHGLDVLTIWVDARG